MSLLNSCPQYLDQLEALGAATGDVVIKEQRSPGLVFLFHLETMWSSCRANEKQLLETR